MRRVESNLSQVFICSGLSGAYFTLLQINSALPSLFVIR